MSKLLDAAPESSTPVDPRRALAAWYLQDWQRGLWTIPLWIAQFYFLALLILSHTFDNPATNLQKSRTEVLALAPPAIPKERNAAEDYALAFKALSAWTGKADDDPALIQSCEGNARLERPEVQAYLQAQAQAIAHLFDASSKAECSWNLDYSKGMNITLPHLSRLRACGRLLALYARDCARIGDHTEAARAIGAIFRMARHTETDPIIISNLVAQYHTKCDYYTHITHKADQLSIATLLTH